MNIMFNSVNHPIFCSAESLLMAVFVCNFLIIVIGFCLKKEKIINNMGCKIILFFLLLTLARFIVPIELPFSITITFPSFFSKIIKFLYMDIAKIGNMEIAFYHILVMIWIIGSIVQTYSLWRKYVKSKRFLLMHGEDVTDDKELKALLQKICEERHKKNVFTLIKIDTIRVPMIFGIFKPYIIIPKDLRLEGNEMYYVLCHEVSHFFNYDLIVKLFMNILTILYWWNPAVYMFRKQANLLLEMQVDNKITKGDVKKKLEYLKCLIDVKEISSGLKEEPTISSSFSLDFLKNNKTDLERRFGLITKESKKKNYVINFTITIIILLAYLLSYRYIFEGYYLPYDVEAEPEDKMAVFFLQYDEIYAIENSDNTYDIYINTSDFPDLFVEKVNDLSGHREIELIYYLQKGTYKD